MPRSQTSTPPPSAPPIKIRGPRQAELLLRFEHLDRQRKAGRLAERILRLVATADPVTAEIAMEIASTAFRMEAPAADVPPGNGDSKPE
jgi:hypothetical protein